MPKAWAAIPIRLLSKAFIAIGKPLPTPFKTFSTGTLQLFKINVQVSDERIPSLSSFFPTENPSNDDSTMNAVVPPCFLTP